MQNLLHRWRRIGGKKRTAVPQRPSRPEARPDAATAAPPDRARRQLIRAAAGAPVIFTLYGGAARVAMASNGRCTAANMNTEFTQTEPKPGLFLEPAGTEVQGWMREWDHAGITVKKNGYPNQKIIPLSNGDGLPDDLDGKHWFDESGRQWDWKKTVTRSNGNKVRKFKSPDGWGRFTEVLNPSNGGGLQTTRRLACFVGDEGDTQRAPIGADSTVQLNVVGRSKRQGHRKAT